MERFKVWPSGSVHKHHGYPARHSETQTCAQAYNDMSDTLIPYIQIKMNQFNHFAGVGWGILPLYAIILIILYIHEEI